MVRKANVKDAAAIAILINQAMGNLAKQFRAAETNEEAIGLLLHFIKKEHNQYSLNNILVYELDGEVVGEINTYDGDQIEELRKPFFDYLTAHYHPNGFAMEKESEGGEFYIDTLSVRPAYQGKGIGKELITAAINWARELGHQKVGLLVNPENPDAKRLYESLGFRKENEVVLLGTTHEHLALNLA